MKKVKLLCVKRYEDRLIVGKVYEATYDPDRDYPNVNFRCSKGMITEVSLNACLPECSDPWFKIIQNKLNKATRTL